MTGLSTSAIQRRIEQQCKQPSGEIAVSDSQATKPAAATDAGRNPIYEGQFDGETPEQAAHRLHWAKAGLAMGRDVGADQHARDSAELRRLCAERDQLRAGLAALKAQPSGVVLPERKSIGKGHTDAFVAGYNLALNAVAHLNQHPSPISLVIEASEEEHGSLRAAAKALGIDAGYLSRLKSGKKLNPSNKVLSVLGLERVTMYRAAPSPSREGDV